MPWVEGATGRQLGVGAAWQAIQRVEAAASGKLSFTAFSYVFAQQLRATRGVNLIRGLTGQSDPECKLTPQVGWLPLVFSYVFLPKAQGTLWRQLGSGTG